MRPLTGGGLATGQVLRVSLDIGTVASGRSVGLAFRNAASNAAGAAPSAGGRVRAVLAPKEPPKGAAAAPAPAVPSSGPGLRSSNSLSGGAK